MAEKEYIEREAIINKIVNTPTVPSRQCYEGNFVYADGVSDRQNEIINYINEQPTADVEPVRHGHWIDNKHTDTAICSECKCVFTDETNYCPKCGSKNGR